MDTKKGNEKKQLYRDSERDGIARLGTETVDKKLFAGCDQPPTLEAKKQLVRSKLSLIHI